MTSRATTTPSRATAPPHEEHPHFGGPRWEMGFAIASGATFGLGMLLEYVVPVPEAWATAFYLATYFFGGFFTFASAFRSVRRGRFEVDFLMLVAALGAAAVGRFAEGAVLLFLFSLGHALEEYAMGRAKRSIEALAELAPRFALVRTPSGEVEERPTEEIRPGEIVLVKPNSRIPADGIVVEGASAVDQAAITGESIPVEKRPVEPGGAVDPATNAVFAGTVNGPGALEVRVSVASGDTTLSRVVAMVREADATKSGTQRFVDRFQRWYVPSVILFVAAVFAFGVWAIDESLADSFYRAMLVLVAASPCALAIATPAAVLAAVARAARAGLLVKGGGPLEDLGRVDAIAFDKTGTLTWGRPELTDLAAAPGVDEFELAQVALALESQSDHPLAGAITRGLDTRVPAAGRLDVDELEAVTGRGVRARIGDDVVQVGSPRLFDEQGLAVPPELAERVAAMQAAGRTTMLVHRGDRFLGVLAVMDTPRKEARDVLDALRASGVDRMVMISGDNQQVADGIGSQVGVDAAIGDLMPEDKVTHIRSMSGDGRVTAMVGDGVNDAPAMANATVGIAMGAAGSAVALETSDIALMSDDIGRLPFLVRLSRASSRLIRQNLVISLGIVAVLVPASLIGLEIGPVVLIHEGSTLLVVLNALRLLRFDAGREHAGIEHEPRR